VPRNHIPSVGDYGDGLAAVRKDTEDIGDSDEETSDETSGGA
jgi:hypothetical protein